MYQRVEIPNLNNMQISSDNKYPRYDKDIYDNIVITYSNKSSDTVPKLLAYQ